jgi:dCTP deaminase
MTILSDRDIKDALQSGRLEITNFQDKHLNPDSYDVTLNREGWGKPEATGKLKGDKPFDIHAVDKRRHFAYIDPLDKESYVTVPFTADEIILWPGNFVLGTVNERIKLSNGLVSELTGKSSLARFGLMVHITAGFGDAGWAGFYVMEFFNAGLYGIKLTAGMPIAQLIFQEAGMSDETYDMKAKSKYKDQTPGQGSKYYLNKEMM